MKQNYYSFWAKRYIKDGLRFMKLVVGTGLSFALGVKLGIVFGVLTFGYVFIDTLKERE